MDGCDERKTMALIGDTAPSTAAGIAQEVDASATINSSFRFVPGELASKCRSLIESYHGIYGYVGLPDMLWLSDARDVIECHSELAEVFKKASRSRGAKRANDSFLRIATAIVALEVLARDFAGWGTRFPTAKRAADKLFGEEPLRRRTWLMDLYLYPPLGLQRELTDALQPPVTRAQTPV
jgi:hypothetical protein